MTDEGGEQCRQSSKRLDIYKEFAQSVYMTSGHKCYHEKACNQDKWGKLEQREAIC